MRIDKYLCDAGLCQSRTLAARLIAEGRVSVNGKTVIKPSEQTEPGDEVSVGESELTKYVSRGGLKLEAAIEAFKPDLTDATALDIGSSTGGFTDCLLKHGVKRVYAVDCGVNQLHESLRGDGRIVLLENTNARFLDSRAVPEEVDIAVMDVSFISQSLLFETVCRFLKSDGTFISLIKPQFECGRANIGKGGIVTDDKVRRSVIENLKASAKLYGLIMEEVTESPIRGGDGNKEYLAVYKKGSIN